MMNLGEETSGMNYGNDDSFGYGRSNNMGNSRMYNTFNTPNRS